MGQLKIHYKVFSPIPHALCGNKRATVLNIWNDKVTCEDCKKTPPLSNLLTQITRTTTEVN